MLLIVVGLVIAASWVIPTWLEARRNYRLRARAVELIGGRLLDAAAKGEGLSATELHALGTVGEVATGRRETARVAMAFTLITIIGVALAALFLSNSDNASELIKTVITSLLTLLGTIVGFYFGTRADEAESNSTASTPSPSGPGQRGSLVGWVPLGPGWIPPNPEQAAPARAAEGAKMAAGERQEAEVEPEPLDKEGPPPEDQPNGERPRE